MYDWRGVLRAHRIPFVESGPHTAKGNVYVRCPWCGLSDQGHHLGISLHGKGWGCWRNSAHRGKSPGRLLGALLGIPASQAEEMLKSRHGAALVADASLSARVKAALGGGPTLSKAIGSVYFTKDIRALEDRGMGRYFVDYLCKRGFTRGSAVKCAAEFKLRYATTGAFSYRLIVPVYDRQGLVTWTGRTIVEDESVRYMSLTTDEEKARAQGVPIALAPITDCIFNEKELAASRANANVLVVCEGPFDAIRIDWFCSWLRATCLFGKNMSTVQVDKLAQLSDRYRKKFLLLDSDATMDAFRVGSRLEPFGFKIARLPGQWKDPGEIPVDQLNQVMREILQ